MNQTQSSNPELQEKLEDLFLETLRTSAIMCMPILKADNTVGHLSFYLKQIFDYLLIKTTIDFTKVHTVEDFESALTSFKQCDDDMYNALIESYKQRSTKTN